MQVETWCIDKQIILFLYHIEYFYSYNRHPQNEADANMSTVNYISPSSQSVKHVGPITSED